MYFYWTLFAMNCEVEMRNSSFKHGKGTINDTALKPFLVVFLASCFNSFSLCPAMPCQRKKIFFLSLLCVFVWSLLENATANVTWCIIVIIIDRHAVRLMKWLKVYVALEWMRLLKQNQCVLSVCHRANQQRTANVTTKEFYAK